MLHLHECFAAVSVAGYAERSRQSYVFIFFCMFAQEKAVAGASHAAPAVMQCISC